MTKQITTLRAAMTSTFHEREAAIDATLTALVAGEHVVLLGRPGTGKSALARALASALTAPYFEYLFTRFSTPEEFLGNFSLKGLEQDIYRRNTAGYLPTAEVAFLDEIFKANAASLNTLLPIINERVIHNGGKVEQIPLEMVVAASNEMPQGEDLSALWDRFLLRVEVEPVRGAAARRALLVDAAAGKPLPKMPQVSPNELAAARKAAVAMPCADTFFDGILSLRAELEQAGIVHGDRRWQKAVKVVKAYAVVVGDQLVESDHVAILADALWDVPAQRDKVREVIGKMVAPALVNAKATFDALNASVKPMLDAASAAKTTSEKLSKMGDVLQALKNGHDVLKKQRADARDGSRAAVEIDRLIEKVKSQHADIKATASSGLVTL